MFAVNPEPEKVVDQIILGRAECMVGVALQDTTWLEAENVDLGFGPVNTSLLRNIRQSYGKVALSLVDSGKWELADETARAHVLAQTINTLNR